eukprot:scaffold23661_cov75-Phaeocystis_antarctica.AAC.4
MYTPSIQADARPRASTKKALLQGAVAAQRRNINTPFRKPLVEITEDPCLCGLRRTVRALLLATGELLEHRLEVSA